jgi:hypothetical protein
MDKTPQEHLDDLHSGDKARQDSAYAALMTATETPVDWAYDVWDALVADLRDKDNRVRAIASQVFANLAKSDPEGRMLTDFPALLNVTRDERTVTARHALQSLWKIGVVGPEQRQILLDGLTQRFNEGATEKNGTLVRYDIAQVLRNVYDAVDDDAVKATALALIETEHDPKYRKKYATVWRAV